MLGESLRPDIGKVNDISSNSLQVNYQNSKQLFQYLRLIENNKVPLRGPLDKQLLLETNYYNDVESSN
jgi:hypothetical protein